MCANHCHKEPILLSAIRLGVCSKLTTEILYTAYCKVIILIMFRDNVTWGWFHTDKYWWCANRSTHCICLNLNLRWKIELEMVIITLNMIIPCTYYWYIIEQECIPVGCVPSAVCPDGGVVSAHGGYTPPSLWTEFLTHACENITLCNFVCGR